ncbi:hypothetical protein HK101_007228, partial [Irineochytrium annulatum]
MLLDDLLRGLHPSATVNTPILPTNTHGLDNFFSTNNRNDSADDILNLLTPDLALGVGFPTTDFALALGLPATDFASSDDLLSLLTPPLAPVSNASLPFQTPAFSPIPALPFQTPAFSPLSDPSPFTDLGNNATSPTFDLGAAEDDSMDLF